MIQKEEIPKSDKFFENEKFENGNFSRNIENYSGWFTVRRLKYTGKTDRATFGEFFTGRISRQSKTNFFVYYKLFECMEKA